MNFWMMNGVFAMVSWVKGNEIVVLGGGLESSFGGCSLFFWDVRAVVIRFYLLIVVVISAISTSVWCFGPTADCPVTILVTFGDVVPYAEHLSCGLWTRLHIMQIRCGQLY